MVDWSGQSGDWSSQYNRTEQVVVRTCVRIRRRPPEQVRERREGGWMNIGLFTNNVTILASDWTEASTDTDLKKIFSSKCKRNITEVWLNFNLLHTWGSWQVWGETWASRCPSGQYWNSSNCPLEMQSVADGCAGGQTCVWPPSAQLRLTPTHYPTSDVAC